MGQGAGVGNATGNFNGGLNAGTYSVVSKMTNLVAFNTSPMTIPLVSSPYVITGNAVTLPSASPGTVIGYTTATDGQGNIQPGIIFSFQAMADANGDAVSPGNGPFTATSNSSGVAATQFVPGWKYLGQRGPVINPFASSAQAFIAQATNFPLPSMVG